jgi:transposase
MSLENLKSKINLSLNEIEQLMEEEIDIKMYKKLLYFKFKAMGYTSVESYTLLSIKKSTAYNLEDLWNEGGYNALLPKSGQGRKTKLSENQLKELNDILSSKESWLVNDVLNLIKDNWNIEYSYLGTQNLLKSLDVKIDNFYEVKQKEKADLSSLIENFNSLSEEDKIEIKNLVDYIKVEKDVNILKKLFYLLFKNLGFSTDLSSDFIGVSYVTGNNWLHRWENEEYSGLSHKKGQGRKPFLNDEQELELKKN